MAAAPKNDFSGEKTDLPRPAMARRGPSFTTRAPRRSRAIVAVVFITLFLLWIINPALKYKLSRAGEYAQGSRMGQKQLPIENQLASPVATKEAALVPLEAHIMSKCPDAQDCLVDFIVPAMERTANMVNWTLSFIGDIDSKDAIHCKHGEEECLGNIMMLCADKLYADPKISLGFSTCLIKDYENIPSRSLVESCALEHAVDFEMLNRCMSEEGSGHDLLRASVQRSKDLGVKYSCTVRLNDKIRCIRDGGQWVDCEDGSNPDDLVNDIHTLYKSSRE